MSRFLVHLVVLFAVVALSPGSASLLRAESSTPSKADVKCGYLSTFKREKKPAKLIIRCLDGAGKPTIAYELNRGPETKDGAFQDCEDAANKVIKGQEDYANHGEGMQPFWFFFDWTAEYWGEPKILKRCWAEKNPRSPKWKK